MLREEGIDSVNVDLSNAFPNELDTGKRGYHHIAKGEIKKLVEPIVRRGTVPVVTGFFGHVKGGIIKGVGRGYTDLTSALTAGALSAKALQVWKESDGVFTGNPTKLDKAKLLSLVTPTEAAELTYFGNEVLHPFTMECAIEDRVPIHILNTFKPTSGGTSIVDGDLEENFDDMIKAREGKYGIIAVCSKKGVPVLNLQSNRQLDSANFYARVFELMAAHNIKADLISTSVANLSVTLHETTPQSRIEGLVADLEEIGVPKIRWNRAIVR